MRPQVRKVLDMNEIVAITFFMKSGNKIQSICKCFTARIAIAEYRKFRRYIQFCRTNRPNSELPEELRSGVYVTYFLLEGLPDENGNTSDEKNPIHCAIDFFECEAIEYDPIDFQKIEKNEIEEIENKSKQKEIQE